MKLAAVQPFDELFTHVDDVTGTQTLYNVTALFAHVVANEHEVERVTVAVDEEHARYCMEQRGVEGDRIQVLVENPDYLKKPILFVKLPDDSHLLVDGTHRYMVYFAVKAPVVPAYIVPWTVAKPFVVEDAPQVPSDELMAWSGLSLLRQLSSNN